jgi:beta-galactosidase
VKSVAGKDGRITDIADPAIDRYRLRWNDVVYEPGEVKVVCYDEAGNVAGESYMRTAAKPVALRMTTDELLPQDRELCADGDDMVFLTVCAVDKNGVFCPVAQDEVTVTVKGAAVFRGICNGDATSLEVFTQPKMKLFNGKLVIGIQAKDVPGKAVVTVKARGMKKAEYKIDVKAADRT